METFKQDDKAEIPRKARGMRFLAYFSLVVVLLLPYNLRTKTGVEFGEAQSPTKDSTKRRSEEMESGNHTKQQDDPLAVSARHQAKFEQQAPLLEATFPLEKRYVADTGAWAVINLKDTPYAYYHIWKSGGSTVAAQTQKRHHGRSERLVRGKRWVTAVRDPIDHFLSGWAECGDRKFQKKERSQELLASYQQKYDLRILSWLKQVQEIAVDGAKPECRMHSMPQANFLLKDGRIVPQLDRVGDMRELPILMKSIGFSFLESIHTTRNATENEFKKKYFPSRRDLLSDNTTRALCDFVALDYFLFDFVPPPVCQGQLEY